MDFIKEKIFLEAGDGIITQKPKKITTILGSCLSITMFHRKTGHAGISHSLYPSCGSKDSYKLFSKDGYKYVDCSFQKLAGYFLKNKINLNEVEIKVFGGGEVLAGGYDKISIGKQNIIMMKEILKENRIVLKAEDIGGTRGRKIIFDTSNGDVFLQKL